MNVSVVTSTLFPFTTVVLLFPLGVQAALNPIAGAGGAAFSFLHEMANELINT